jgi:hypothetical protein
MKTDERRGAGHFVPPGRTLSLVWCYRHGAGRRDACARMVCEMAVADDTYVQPPSSFSPAGSHPPGKQAGGMRADGHTSSPSSSVLLRIPSTR